MPRNWRCAGGHAWTGELGALTFCPECGSADVYEVRGPLQPSASPATRGQGILDGGATFVQPAVPKTGAPASIGDTFVLGYSAVGQSPDLPADRTFIQPALGGGDTPAQAATDDSGTTQVQLPVPGDGGDTIHQIPGTNTDDGATLVQAPTADGGPSTLDLPAVEPYAPTLPPPAGPAHPTLDQTRATPPVKEASTAETRVYTPKPAAAPADGGTMPRTAAEMPTLDGSGPEGPAYRTADYPETVSVHEPAAESPIGISRMDTRTAPPPPARGRDARSITPPPVEGYEILSVLGRGGMGVVYKARQIRLNRVVALKMILAGGHAGAYERQRFLTESQAVAALHHPNIVQIYETGERDGLPYFSLEFCDGGSLQQKLGGQPMPPKVAADVAEQLARAMQYAHERGIVHRDLKPANILFAGAEAATAAAARAAPTKDSKAPTKDSKTTSKETKSGADPGKSVGASKTSQSKTGHSFLSSKSSSTTSSFHGPQVSPKVTDFGLAKRLEDDSGLTGSGTILGTPSYMSPEQASGKTKEVGPPTDIHALGAILYEMLTGRPPFLGENVVETMNQVRTMDPVPPTRVQPRTPHDLETICLKCLQKEIHKRYASAGEMADDLRRFLDGEPIAARPVSVVEKGWKWAKRRPAQAGLIAVCVGGLILAAIGGLWFAQYQRQQATQERELKDQAKAEYERAEANFLSAREAVDNLLVRIGAERLEQVPRAEKLRKQLLVESLLFYQRFLSEHGDNPAVRREAGWAYQRLGRVRSDLGERKLAITAYQKAAELFDSIAREPSENQVKDKLDLAITHRQLAVVLEADGRRTDADQAYERARAGLRELADANSEQPDYRRQLAELLLNRGGQFFNRRRLVEAEDAMRQALGEYNQLCRIAPTQENQLRRAKAQANLGAVILVAGRTAVALTELGKAVDLLVPLAHDHPNNPECVKELGQAVYNLGTAQWKAGDAKKAEATYRDAIARLTKLSADFPQNRDYRSVLAEAHDNLAMLLLSERGLRAAEPERNAAREIYRQLVSEAPDEPEYRYRYALDRDYLATFLAQTGSLSQAIDEEKAAVDLLRGLVAADPTNADLVSHLARQRLNLGQLYAGIAQATEAATEYAQAAALFEELADRRATDDKLWQELPDTYMNEARVFLSLRQGGAAERAMRQSVSVARRIATNHADQPDAIAKSAKTQANLAILPTVKPAESLNLLREAVRWQQAALKLAPAGKRDDYANDLGQYSLALIVRLTDDGDHAAASREATDTVTGLPRGWPGLTGMATQLARCVRLARTDKSLSDDQKAKLSAAYGEQALDLLRRALADGYKDAAALKASPELNVLRTDPAFRPEFEKLLANIKK